MITCHINKDIDLVMERTKRRPIPSKRIYPPSDDYRKVRVPMLPAVFELKKTLRYIMATVLLMYLASILLYFLGQFGPIYLGVALVSGFLISLGNVYLVLRPSRQKAWMMFKVSSPYLFLLFAGMIIDVLIRY